MSEWINTADCMPEENEKVLIQLPTTHDFTMARHTDGAFYDGYLRYCNIEWWQRINNPPSPTFKPGDEVIIDSGKGYMGVVLCHDKALDDWYWVYSAKNRMVLAIQPEDMKTTGVTYKDFVDTINALEERQRQLCSK